jgi:probable rRNA maturation factor
MGFSVSVLNRQRKYGLKADFISGLTSRIPEALFANLLKSPPAHLKKKDLKAMLANGELSLVFVNSKQIKQLNKQWRQKDYVTDVLSFPMDVIEDDGFGDGLPLEIGEVIVCLEKAFQQAEEYRHSFEREIAFLFVHGFLHVLGFDHMNEKDEKEMFSRQKAILKAAGYSRK